MTTYQVQNCIHILQSIDPAKPNAYDTAVNAFRQMGIVPFFILDFPDLPINVFHTRTHETNNYFEDFSDIGLPPQMAVKNFGRCNIPYQSVFYCSDLRPTSYMELLQYWAEEKKEEFLYVTIGKWVVENSLKLLIVTSPFEIDRCSDYDKLHGIKLDDIIDQQSAEMKSAMILFYKFIFDKFRRPAKKDLQTYIITSAYSNLAFGQTKDPIDAICYPSVPYEGQGVNLAIRATYPFEKNMKLNLVARDTFKRIEKDTLPTFQSVDFKETRSFDHKKARIEW